MSVQGRGWLPKVANANFHADYANKIDDKRGLPSPPPSTCPVQAARATSKFQLDTMRLNLSWVKSSLTASRKVFECA